ncbi:MAG: 50S ribosomal protein L22 [Candidatus Roizmanbacteria bacterium GW2011_GWC2_37_13]|uniref:50S ribosomal protein L22 n=1 Tax=Candidatus Roizmanbacteria bacterium GW2011_GWC2_37_13 TaxID=1618486 RepID=A0A0G0IR58_9BACT|nr:MAG: 50S ribosomal protein L22P, large subunit ribosomal protein L22 [Candidatus Roizmanbacteria bacterium GW2011_GWC1_37_12]KKQ26639.1 MAG: 50S ribosomal protein L22 [Candidatus Roizmanbacteria bacterium GW2011_GWC2_37_13]
MEKSKTYLKNIAMSPKKLRFYIESIKKMSPAIALDHLFYGKQKATKILYQALKSAISNAKQSLKVEDDLLKFGVFTIEEGRKLKRYRPGGRGTPKPIVKRRSHIKIVLIKSENDKSMTKSKLQIKKTSK